MTAPKYPTIEVCTRSRNPFALVAAVREGLRRAHVEQSEIERFSSEALSHTESPRQTRQVCNGWVQIRGMGC